MMTLPKIEEWIKEVEARPGSAMTILKLIAGRLRGLSERNEELLAENIALQDGSRVEEYRKRIAHLEYQLELLKRRFGLDQEALAALSAEPAAVPLVLLVYHASGRILRVEPGAETAVLGQLSGEMSPGGEPPRLLALPANEELLLLFSSGRVSTCPVEDIPPHQAGGDWSLEQAALPDEPHAGERLACVMPLSGLALADFFLQASRRGCVKKTMSSMAETVLENHYLGRGAIQRKDQPLDLTLCRKGELYVIVTQAGRLLGLDVDELPYSVEERIKLDATDHVVAGFIIRPDELLLCLTQTGKVISRQAGFIEPMKSSASRGQALIPLTRLEQGVRFINAAPVRETDLVAVLDAAGNLSLHSQGELTGAGVVKSENALLAFGIVPAADGGGSNLRDGREGNLAGKQSKV
jgi:DNA gyrase/topoisomerase IV subunit A